MTADHQGKWRILGFGLLALLGFSNVALLTSQLLTRSLERTLWALSIALVVPVLLLVVWITMRRLLSLRRIKAIIAAEPTATAVLVFLKGRNQKYARFLGAPGVLLLSDTDIKAWICPPLSKSKLLYTLPYADITASLLRLKTFRPCYALIVKSKDQASATFRAIPIDSLLWRTIPVTEFLSTLQRRPAFAALLPTGFDTKPASKYIWRHVVFVAAYTLMVLIPWGLQSMTAVDGYHAAQVIRANEAQASASIESVQQVTSVTRYGDVSDSYIADYSFHAASGERIFAKQVHIHKNEAEGSTITVAYNRNQPDYSLPAEDLYVLTIVTPIGVVALMTGLILLMYLYLIGQVRG